MWKYIVPVIATGLLAWGAWATVGVTSATPREVFDRHVERSDEKFERVQKTLDDKIQKIYDHLIGDDE